MLPPFNLEENIMIGNLVVIGIIYFIFAILPEMKTERKLDNYDMSRVDSTKMFLDKYENDLSDQEVRKNVVAGKYDK